MTHQNLTCDAFESLLPEYLEGTLGDSSLADAELHLAACATCRALVSDLRAITHAAAALPGIAPSRDLWPEIEARTRTTVVPLAARPHRWSPRALGAIAAALVGITALGTWQLAMRSRPEAPSFAATPAPAVSAPESVVAPLAPDTPDTPVAQAAAVRERQPRPEAGVTYATEIDRLSDVITQRSNELDPATVAILQRSMATIDSAITQARDALARDPGSRFLTQQLNHSLQRKLGLLRTAALLPST